MIKIVRRFKCLYEVLGVNKDASREEIKKAYYELAKTHHPDVQESQEQVSGFSEVTKAYETLGDEDKRYEYDLEQGYLNALDIDRMEGFREKAGTRYPEKDVWRNFNEIDKELGKALDKDPWVLLRLLGKRKKEEGGNFDDLKVFRMMCLFSFSFGSVATYSLFMYIFEQSLVYF